MACAGGEGAHQRGCIGGGRPCPHQWGAREGTRTRLEDRRCPDHRARSRRAHPQSGRVFGAARRCDTRAPAL